MVFNATLRAECPTSNFLLLRVRKEAECDAWLPAMREALKDQGYDEELKVYLISQIANPAKRIRHISQVSRQK